MARKTDEQMIEGYKLSILKKEETIKKLQSEINLLQKRIVEINKKEEKKQLVALGDYMKENNITTKDLLEKLKSYKESKPQGGNNYGTDKQA